MAKTSLLKTCKFEQCTKRVKGFGYCINHYRRFKKYGDPAKTAKVRTDSLAAMFDYYLPKDRQPLDCWEWQGVLNNFGYGVLNFQYKQYGAHRVSWFLATGVWPEYALHKCDNKPCVNPAHLYSGSVKDNVRDALERGQKPIGERVKSARLKDADLIIIWRMIWDGNSNKEISECLQIGRDQVGKIRRGESWKQVSKKIATMYHTPETAHPILGE